MSAKHDTIRQLFDAGEYGRIVEDTRHFQLDGRTDLSLAALVAHASFEAGAQDRAQALASGCLDSSLSGVRARAQLVLALCLRASGQVTEARRSHQASIRSSEEASDDDLEAWTSLHLLRHLVITAPRNVAAAMLPGVRAKVLRSGSPHLAAYLHATVAVGEGHAGRIGEAQRHCRLADALIRESPHAWLNCSVLGTSAAIELAACNLAEATRYLTNLQQIAQDHRLEADRIRANVNVGHLAYVTGDYETAERALREVMQSPLASRIVKLTAAEGFAKVCLVRGRLAECEAVLRSVELNVADDFGLAHVRGVQWAQITRARLLLRLGDPKAAVERLERVQAQTREIFDRPLMAAAHMAAAQAFTVNGQAASASRQLAASLAMNPTNLPELQGQFYYAAASTLEDSGDNLGRALRQRARRIWALQGMTALEREFVLPFESTALVRDSRSTPFPPTPALVVDSIAGLLNLGATPALLVEELQHSIRMLDCSAHVKLASASDETKTADSMELLVQRPGSPPVKVVCAVPESPDRVLTLGSVIRVGELALELERLRDAERSRAALWPERSAEAAAGIIFETSAMREILTVARRIADTTVPVLITGETGTGKEVLARLIHSYSSRSKNPFLPFNCTSMSRDMSESQLFGHRRGSFTGATEDYKGVIRAANHGTLLLDEIGDMHFDVQPKLLRFLESDEIHSVGEPHPQKVDVRVIAATNADLKTLVAKGEFREDLYYRLNIVPIHLPPLRERRGEIPALVNHYLEKYARDFRKGDLRLAEETMDHLVLSRWPGNVRQLANQMRRVAALAEPGGVIMPEDLSSDIVRSRDKSSYHSEPRPHEVSVGLDQRIAAAVEQIERAMVIHALKKTRGLLEPAAKTLGLSRKGLYLKRQRYQITDSELDDDVATASSPS